MASNPPGSCCYKGVVHEGTSTGSIEKVGDFEAYVKSPEEKTDKGVLIITDVIGHKFVNAQLIADQFAANGYLAFMPDLFYGDPIKLGGMGDGFDIMKWLHGEYNSEKKPHTPPIVDPIIETSIETMKSKYGIKKIGAVGYCFGGKYVVRFLKPGKVDVGFTAHPSFVDADELKAIRGPLSIAAAETDSIFPSEKRHESEVILKETKLPYQINLYSGVEHGFSVRCDLSNKVAKYAKEAAFIQALQWFEEHL